LAINSEAIADTFVRKKKNGQNDEKNEYQTRCVRALVTALTVNLTSFE